MKNYDEAPITETSYGSDFLSVGERASAAPTLSEPDFRTEDTVHRVHLKSTTR